MIKHPGLVGEPGGGPGIAGTKAQPGLDRFESCLVAAVKAQPNSKVEMTEGEVPVQLDRAAQPEGQIPVPDARMERSLRPSRSPIARSVRGRARGGRPRGWDLA